MIPVPLTPECGQWYLSATCQQCGCKILLFQDLNDGNGTIEASVHVTCPRCKLDQDLAIEHYQHEERRMPELCIQFL